VTVLQRLRTAARRRVAFHLSNRRRPETQRAVSAGKQATPIHDDVMSPKGPHFIAAKA
jgi:hypothetical protein